MTTPPLPGVVDRIVLRGKTYTILKPSDLTLKMLLQLEIETEQFGKRMTLADFERLDAEWAAHRASTAGASIHPAAVWLVAVTVWASKRLAGEEVTFEDAIDFSFDEIKAVPTPQDRKPPAGRKAAPRKARPSKAASGRAGARQAANLTEPPTKSEPESSSESS